MNIKTIATMWKAYEEHCCPHPPASREYAEAEQAFWAGATSTIDILRAISKLPDRDAKAAYETLEAEIVEFNRQRLDEAARIDAESN